MFMKLLFTPLFFVVFMSFSLCAFSQTYFVSGTVKDADGEVLSFASVSLLNGADSSWIQTAQSNETGHYELNSVGAGVYLIDVQLLGYTPVKQKQIVTGNTKGLDIVLNKSTTQMDGVLITGKRKRIETELGKTIVNISDDMKAGNNLLDLLKKMPGVVVGVDGTVSITGKEGVVVLVDDKPVRLSGRELAEYLKAIGAQEVVKIELMTQPSAKYDAEGNAGIINVRMDKNRKQGWGGTANVSYLQGKYPFASVNSNITYRKDKLTYTLSPGYYKGQGYLNSTKESLSKQDGETIAVITEEAFKKETFPDYSLKAGVDYDMTDKTTLALSAKGIYHTNEETDKITSTIDDRRAGQFIYNNSENKNGHVRTHIELDGYLKHEIDSNSNVQVNAGSFFNRRGIYQQLISTDYNEDKAIIREPFILNNTVPDQTNQYVIKADYENKIDNVKVEFGVKANLTTLDEENIFDRYTNNAWINDTSRTNRFLYKETVSAAYVNSTTAINKLQLQGGLRVEHTYAEGNQVTQDIKFTRNYVSLFPTAFANYKVNDNHTIEVNYGRRLRRPNYRDLNPFSWYASQYSVRTGNLLIQPQFTHNVELKHNFKGRFITIANWSETLGTFIEQLVFDNSTNVSTRFYSNSGRNSRLSLFGHYTNQIYSWLNLGLMAGGHYTEFEADYNGVHQFASATGFYASIDTQFSLNNGWSASAHSRYAGPYRQSVVQTVRGSMWLNAEVAKTMFKDTATVKLSVQDPFHTYRNVYDVDQSDVSVSSSMMFNTQTVTLAFSYNFGKRDELRQRQTVEAERM